MFTLSCNPSRRIWTASGSFCRPQKRSCLLGRNSPKPSGVFLNSAIQGVVWKVFAIGKRKKPRLTLRKSILEKYGVEKRFQICYTLDNIICEKRVRSMKKSRTFDAVTGLKGICIILIVFYHTLPQTTLIDKIPFTSFIRIYGGNLGNYMFFMISGFLIA